MLQVNVTSDNQNDKLTSDRNSGLVSFIYNGFVLVSLKSFLMLMMHKYSHSLTILLFVLSRVYAMRNLESQQVMGPDRALDEESS